MRSELRPLLCCPACRSELHEDEGRLKCAACGRAFPIREDVPELLLDEAEPPARTHPSVLGRLLESVVALPVVYDRVQRFAGADRLFARLREALAPAENTLVLDVGAGTGSLEPLLPPSAKFLWLDSDAQKLSGFRQKSTAPAVLADATRLPFIDGSVDWTVSVGVSHHLDDEALAAMLDEIRRVTRRRFLFLDAVVTPAPRSRVLWRYDRGRHPRTAERLRNELTKRFAPVSEVEFTILHRYLLVVSR